MQVKYKFSRDSISILLCGELDEHSAKEVREEIDEVLEDNRELLKSVIFDLSSLSFMDSTGIGVLIGRYKKIKSFNGKTYVQSPSISIEKILKLSGIYNIIPKIS